METMYVSPSASAHFELTDVGKIAHGQGSFERIGELCTPDSLPQGYISSAKRHALEGCYVLGLSHK